MEKEQVKKIQRNNPQQRLFNHILKQSHTNETTNYPLYSTLPGITKIRSKIDALIIQPLLSNTFACKNVICRGPTGTGKSFVIESICNEYKLKLLTCKCTELADTLQKARVIKKCIVMIYDIEKVEDFDVTYNVIETLKSNKDVCVIAEVNEEIDKRYRKYGCFEEEIVFDIPDNDEKCEILSFLYKKYIDIPSNINFTEIAKSIPAYTPSDISILTRRVKLRIIDNICNDKTYYEVLKESNIRKTDVTFDDIGGMHSVKDELYKYIVAPIINAETYKKFGIKTSAGILLHGPPGCGKTMLAKAVSNVACCNFISVKGPEIINKYVGNTEKALREIFEKAQNLQPCVIFFDEIDSLCCKRGNNDFNDRVVNQFLTLLDGIETRRNVFVLGATNRKDRIDEAFLRSGRFDRCIEIALPDRDEKEKIFEKYTKDKKCEVFDFEELDTTDFSGADIYGMVQQAFIEFITHNTENTDGAIDKSYFINAANNIQKERSK